MKTKLLSNKINRLVIFGTAAFLVSGFFVASAHAYTRTPSDAVTGHSVSLSLTAAEQVTFCGGNNGVTFQVYDSKGNIYLGAPSQDAPGHDFTQTLNLPVSNYVGVAISCGPTHFFEGSSDSQGSTIFSVSPTTLNVSSDAASVTYRNAIIKTADRLVATQNTDGGWDWQNPDSNPLTGSEKNTLGVTAEILVDAYRLTHNQSYLTAINKTFALLQTNSATPNFKLRGPDISFLIDSSIVTGDSQYANFAKTGWDNDKTNFGSGTATGFGNYVRDLRHSQGLDGLIPWDINLYVQGVAKLSTFNSENATYNADAIALAQVIFDDANSVTPLFDINDDTEHSYLFGLTGMLSAMSTVTTVNSAITANDISTKLLSYNVGGAFIDLNDTNAQGSTPTVDDHLTTIQTTAYAVKALKQAAQDASAQTSIDYLIAQRDSSGAWKDGANENTEVDSEAGNALATKLNVPNTFYTISDAINAASSGDMVNVGAGTYNEQVVIDGKDLTLKGAGDTTIIQPSAPSILSTLYAYPSGVLSGWVGVKLAPVILVENNASVTVKDLKVDGINVTTVPSGASRVTGILYGESGGIIDNATITTIVVDSYNTRSYGIDLSAVGTARNVELKNSHITNWARNGIQAMGASLTANIHDNTLVGPGLIGPANVPNGIVFIHGVGGNATRNTISNGNYNGSIYKAYGIMTYDPVTPGITLENNEIFNEDIGIGFALNSNDATASGNNLHNNEVGVWFEDGATNNAVTGNTIINNTAAGIGINNDSAPGTGNYAHHNTISNNPFGINNLDMQVFDAASNWWGTASSTEIAAEISGSVTYDPWYINAGRTVLNTDVAGSTINVPTGNIDFAETSDGEVSLPSGSSALNLGNDSLLDLSNATTSMTSTDVTVGGNIVTLTQSVILQSGVDTQPITLTNSNLDGVSASIPDGTKIQGPVGWDGTMQPPKTATGSGSTPSSFSVGNTVVEVGSPGAVLLFDKPVTIVLNGVTGVIGYKPAGSNTWTAINGCSNGDFANPTIPAFPGECAVSNGVNTKIVTYHFSTFATLDRQVVPVSSGNGGGGGGGTLYVPTPTPTPTVTLAPITGQVLGAATFNFAADLKIGAQGNDVTELQNRLTKEGVYSGPITGYFGQLTLKAVKAFQAKYSISQIGTVGPLTRAQLNGSQVAGVSMVNSDAVKAQIAAIQAQLTALLQQLAQALQAQINQHK